VIGLDAVARVVDHGGVGVLRQDSEIADAATELAIVRVEEFVNLEVQPPQRLADRARVVHRVHERGRVLIGADADDQRDPLLARFWRGGGAGGRQPQDQDDRHDAGAEHRPKQGGCRPARAPRVHRVTSQMSRPSHDAVHPIIILN
jgi:hypothetical protein